MLTRREFSKSVLGGAALLASADLSPAASPAAKPSPPQGEGSKKYDLLIKGGTVVDPGQRLHALLDIGVKDGKILDVSQDIP